MYVQYLFLCLQCKYDFCWICLEEWKKHSSSTGGYYRCTRYEVITQLEEQSKEMTGEVHTHTYLFFYPRCDLKYISIKNPIFPNA